MAISDGLDLRLRSQRLARDDHGRTVWEVVEAPERWRAAETALLLCDVWDRHWCRGAVERLEAMIPRMEAVVRSLRERGLQVIHAPSDTMAFYEGHPARARVRAAPLAPPPPIVERPDPPLPVDASDGGADTGETDWYHAWSRQHPGISIDPDRDGISDNGDEVYNFLQAGGRRHLLILGVHTNMCVLGRSFAIRAMVRRGVQTALVRDLTDAMYNPERSPYVSHEEGTRLVVAYIEKFWCPTVASEELLEQGRVRPAARNGS
jgi:nicotinamidase-related amidase